MQTNPPTDPFLPAILGFLGAIVGSGVSIATSWLLNRHAAAMQRAQWATEEKRAEKIEAKAERDRALTARKAARDEALEQHAEIVAGFAKIGTYLSAGGGTQPDYMAVMGDTENRMAMFLATFPDKGVPEFVEIEKLCFRDPYALRNRDTLNQLKMLMYSLAKKDSRLSGE